MLKILAKLAAYCDPVFDYFQRDPVKKVARRGKRHSEPVRLSLSYERPVVRYGLLHANRGTLRAKVNGSNFEVFDYHWNDFLPSQSSKGQVPGTAYDAQRALTENVATLTKKLSKRNIKTVVEDITMEV